MEGGNVFSGYWAYVVDESEWDFITHNMGQQVIGTAEVWMYDSRTGSCESMFLVESSTNSKFLYLSPRYGWTKETGVQTRNQHIPEV